jgi:hypothetical protein
MVALIMLVISCALTQQQESERRRQDPTVSRTGYVPPHVRQHQRVPASEEEAEREIRRRQEEDDDETDEEIAKKVKGHLAQMLEAGELASADGISFGEALQQLSSDEQETQEGNTIVGTFDAVVNTDTVV